MVHCRDSEPSSADLFYIATEKKTGLNAHRIYASVFLHSILSHRIILITCNMFDLYILHKCIRERFKKYVSICLSACNSFRAKISKD